MTDHILNAELCAKCPARICCLAIVPDGAWNPYIGKKPCPAILQKPRDDAPAALYHANQLEKMHP